MNPFDSMSTLIVVVLAALVGLIGLIPAVVGKFMDRKEQKKRRAAEDRARRLAHLKDKVFVVVVRQPGSRKKTVFESWMIQVFNNHGATVIWIDENLQTRIALGEIVSVFPSSDGLTSSGGYVLVGTYWAEYNSDDDESVNWFDFRLIQGSRVLCAGVISSGKSLGAFAAGAADIIACGIKLDASIMPAE